MPGIIINNEPALQRLLEFHADRTAVQAPVATTIYPGLLKFLAKYNAFLAKWGPNGTHYDSQIWEHFLTNEEPTAPYKGELLNYATLLIAGMETIERIAPGTFGFTPPPLPAAEEPDGLDFGLPGNEET